VSLPLAREEVDRFRALVAGRLGLQFDDGKLDDLEEYLRRRVESSGLRSFARYLEALQDTAGSRDELRCLAEELTVGETYFFRNPNHFRAFRERVLPELLAAPGRERPLRILSAGCASGEEPYTLSMLVLDSWPAGARRSEILGIDVNPRHLEKARSGRYTPWSLRATPLEAQHRWFSGAAPQFAVLDEVRSAVAFEERNLLEDDAAFWRPGAFDVIFCRNVLIYFSQEAVRATVDRFARALSPGGFLFLGDAENLRGLTHDFQLHHTHDTFYYQRRAQPSGAPARPPAPAPRPPAPWPSVVALDDSWVSAIHGASERISRLAQEARPPRPAAPPPAAPAPAPAATPTWDLTRALQLFRQERYADAAEALAALPGEAAQDTDVELMRASLLTNMGDVAAAAAACERVLALDELNAGAHYLLALCDEHGGRLDDAVRHDEVAVYLDPAFAMPRLHLGRLAKRRGDRALARSELGRALDLLAREDVSRIVLFGGGFSREALIQVCRVELEACGGAR
jgi:chemotaxis protein methyltransferase CheR